MAPRAARRTDVDQEPPPIDRDGGPVPAVIAARRIGLDESRPRGLVYFEPIAVRLDVAGELIGAGRSFTHELVRRGELPAFRLPNLSKDPRSKGELRILLSDLRAWCAARVEAEVKSA